MLVLRTLIVERLVYQSLPFVPRPSMVRPPPQHKGHDHRHQQQVANGESHGCFLIPAWFSWASRIASSLFCCSSHLSIIRSCLSCILLERSVCRSYSSIWDVDRSFCFLFQSSLATGACLPWPQPARKTAREA